MSLVRLVDIDTVEAKNLACQFCYNQADIGRPKVEAAADWVRAYSPETRVEPLVERIGDPHRVALRLLHAGSHRCDGSACRLSRV